MQETISLLGQHGLLLVFANVLVTQLGIPIPAIPLLIIAGSFAYDGQLGLAQILAVAVIASLLGDLPWFYAGRAYGYRVLNRLCRLSLEPASCVSQTEGIFERWGAPSLTVAKFVPGFATIAPPLAGATRLPLSVFLVYSTVGALLWAGAAVAAGWLLHAQVDSALAWLERMGGGAVLVVAAVIGVFIAFKWIQRLLFFRLMRMARITVDELEEMRQGNAGPVVLDARSSGARRVDARRIPGAIAVDPAAPDQGLAGISQDNEVVVYCT
jgi:membrane protein DedA with SNARE-associated domain